MKKLEVILAVAAGLSFTTLAEAAGASPWENSFYGVDKFGVVNCSLSASKDVAVGALKIPAFVQFMANPTDKRLFMCIGLSF